MGVTEYPEPVDASGNLDVLKRTEGASPSEPLKKKRKAWGQPIPDFKVVLPPRKRAKTAEEKEQRKNERVIRNRKAADKSRQRQKAAVAELEVKTSRMETELAQLRVALSQYQSAFGVLPGTSIPESTLVPPSSQSQSLPVSTTTSPYDCATPAFTPDDTTSYSTTPVPTLSMDSPRPSVSIKQSSPLAPTLFPTQLQPSFADLDEANHFLDFASSEELSGMTQYPAEILCGLQCQPETLTGVAQSEEEARRFNFRLSLINLTMLMTIYETFSSTMLFPLCQIFRTLAEGLPMISNKPDLVDSYFPMIHSLITKPTSKTTRPIFRMKLLSRLLACSPSTARLIEAATDRALQRLVDDEAILYDPEGRQRWASLLATKWAIQRVQKEHQRYRLVVDGPRKEGEAVPELVRQMGLIKKMNGVDYGAVERSLWRWRLEETASV